MPKKNMNITFAILIILTTLLMNSCAPIADQVIETTQKDVHSTQEQPIENPGTESSATPTNAPGDTSSVTPTVAPVFEPWIQLEQIASGLTAPVAMAAPDDSSSRLFIVDQVGVVFIIDSKDDLLETPFIDIRDRMVPLNTNYDERGLLGMAFHPDFGENGRFFLYYSAALRANGPDGWNHTSHLSEFSISTNNPNQADPTSEKLILQIDQPQGNHNSGAITFGPDGYLYIPLGDGGGAHDRGLGHAEDWYVTNDGGNGQDVEQNMLGSILRIDIDNGDPYAIPEDNPKVSQNFPEIWAYGFRNPYRMAFDLAGEHELFVGDAGQELWEEISIVEAGGN
ncbi:MAG: PQQ-dependent sugar dehydrogenase, partial [Anaerolineales bacterium]